jgi:hypothetical protein
MDNRTAAARMTPAEIDAIWLPLLERIYQNERWIALDRQKIADPDTLAFYRDRAKATLAEHLAERQRLVNEADPFAEQWSLRGGWTRYHLVTNGDGHFHRDRNCSTCFVSTQFGIVPATSGLDEGQLVAMVGQDACTVCFPNAPASQAWRDGVSYSKAEKDARRDAATRLRIAKAEKKVAYWERTMARLRLKMVTAGGNPDFTGEPVDVFFTIRDSQGYHTDPDEATRYYIGCDIKNARQSLRYALSDLETAGVPIRQRAHR